MPTLAGNPHVTPSALDALASGKRLRTQLTICETATSSGGRSLIEYYESHRARGVYPRRSEMPSRELMGIMPDIFLLEPVDAEGTDWRFRLVGQGLVSRLGVDPTGMCISTAYAADDATRNAGDYQDIAVKGTTRITRGSFIGIDREFLEMEIVHVPMLGADDTTRWVLGGLFVNDCASQAPVATVPAAKV